MKSVEFGKGVLRSRRLLGSLIIALGIFTGGFSIWMSNAPAGVDRNNRGQSEGQPGAPGDGDGDQGEGGEEKCVVCHVPRHNAENAHTITIACKAAEKHLRKHPLDCLGPCPCQPTPKTNP